MVVSVGMAGDRWAIVDQREEHCVRFATGKLALLAILHRSRYSETG